jgi:hypothetical protein
MSHMTFSASYKKYNFSYNWGNKFMTALPQSKSYQVQSTLHYSCPISIYSKIHFKLKLPMPPIGKKVKLQIRITNLHDRKDFGKVIFIFFLCCDYFTLKCLQICNFCWLICCLCVGEKALLLKLVITENQRVIRI